jgi:hypothetical protein
LSRAGFGKNKSIICRCADKEIVQFLYAPFVLTFISKNADLKRITEIGNKLESFMNFFAEQINKNV